MWLWASVIVMVSPATPVPLSVGVVSLVMLSPATPLSLLGSKITVGADGAVLSMVIGNAVAGLLLPAGSVAVTLKLFSPCGNGLLRVALQVPFGCTVAVAMMWLWASVIVMMSPATPVPLSVGVVLLLRLSPTTPLSLLGSKTAVGANDAMLSMVIGNAVAGLLLPAASVAVTLKLFNPCGSGLLGIALQVPFG